MPINLKQRNITKFKVLLKSYTQPFFAILVLIWITIIIINLNLLTNKKNNDIIKKDVITQSNSKSPIENKHKDVITQSNDKSSIENKHKDDSVTIKK